MIPAVGRFHVETLGCPKNAVDSDKVVASLLADGLERAHDAGDADLVVVNTCAFVEAARQESIDTPKRQVCETCLMPVARVLCKRDLGVDLDAEGVDREFWMRRADAVIYPMMRRRRELARDV